MQNNLNGFIMNAKTNLMTAVFVTLLFALNAHAETRYVRPDGNDSNNGTTWALAKKTINSAVSASAAGDEVVVTNGTYGVISTSNKSITIRSVNGADVTIIDAGGASMTRCATLGASKTERNTILTGFTLQNGNMLILNGGGVQGGTLNDCVLMGNVAVTFILNNQRDGGYGGGAYGSTLNNCWLVGNLATWAGGGASDCTLNNCVIIENAGGDSTYATDGGGGAYSSTLNNCILLWNQARGNSSGGYGGGARNCTLNNCTIFENKARSGGGVRDGTINNSIVWANVNNSGAVNNYSGGTFNYSCTTPSPGGIGNITSNPLFRDAANGYFQLQAGSPCIDKGNNTYVTWALDLDDNPRIHNGTVDMGAFEYWVAMHDFVFFKPNGWGDSVFLSDTSSGKTPATSFTHGQPIYLSYAYTDNNNMDFIGSMTNRFRVTVNGETDTLNVNCGNLPAGAYSYLDGYAWPSLQNLQPGTYTVTATLNDGDIVPESNYANNTRTLTFTVEGIAVTFNGNGGDPSTQVVLQKLGGKYVLPASNPTREEYTFVGWFTAASGGTQVTSATTVMQASIHTLYAQWTPVIYDPVWYVDASKTNDDGNGRTWGSAKKTINAAVTLAAAGETIYVADGVYGMISTANKAILIQSMNGAATTIIDGGGTNRCAVLGSSTSHTSTVLSGFTLQNGYINGNGGGAYYGTLQNCILTNNTATSMGGGSYYGVLNNCLLVENEANIAGGACYGVFQNCALIGNTARLFAGGAYAGEFNNCTLARNSTGSGGGGGTYLGTLKNSVIWGNTSSGGENNYHGGTFSYSCTAPLPEGDEDGGGNIAQDPKFVDAENGIFRLQPDSPCIRVGSMLFAVGAVDLDGNPRTQNGSVSMGAHEYVPVTVTVTLNGQGVTLSPGSIGAVSSYPYGTLPTPTRTGYTFAGWFTAANGGTQVTSATVVTMESNHTLFALWTPMSYVITYANTKGAANTNPATYTIEDAVIFAALPDVAGYTFAGWDIAQIAVGSTSAKTITAQWTPVAYAITYANTKGAANTNPATYTIENAVAFAALPDVAGYTFAGWDIAQITVGSTGAKTITAQWTPVAYAITYANTKGAANTNPATYTIENTVTFAALPDVAGYTFAGWDIAQIAIGSTGAKTITAQWTPVAYAISYANTKGAANTNPATYTIENAVTFAALPDVAGYTFAGWDITQIAVGSTGAKTITAQWAVAFSLGESVNAPHLEWSTGGGAEWFAQAAESHDGFHSARSGAIGDDDESWIETTVNGPGTLSFWWKVSSEAQTDCLYFLIDGEVAMEPLSGWKPNSSFWAQETFVLDAGTHTVRWCYVKDETISKGEDCGWLDNVEWTPYVPVITLGEAVNASQLSWQTSGDADWFPQTDESHDGLHAARSGAIGDNESTWIETTVIGSGTLSFWWRVSSEGGADVLDFLVDGQMVKSISGTKNGWLEESSIAISGDGSHSLRWRYRKDVSDDLGEDCGWLDAVTWMSAAPPETQTTPRSVPFSWLDELYPGHDGDYETLANSRGANGYYVWESYVAGLDPINADSVFFARIEIVNGNPVVMWNPDLEDARDYTLFGKPSLDAPKWVELEPDNIDASMRFFKVSVDLPQHGQ